MSNKILDNMTGQEIKELINKEKISIEDLDASALRILMNYEIDMLCFGQGDIELISQCSNRLNEINDNGITDEHFYNAINNAKAKYIVEQNFTSNSKKKVTNKKHFIIRRVGLVAAILALLIAGSTLVAAAFGFNVLEYLSQVIRQPEGSKLNVDSFTFYHNGEARKYVTIEDMIQSEHLDIMYPSKLPDGIAITSVELIKSENEKNIVLFILNDIDTYITVYESVSSTEGTFKDSEIYIFNNLTYYIREDNNTAFCYHGKNSYSIKAKNYEDLILIINNMKD